MPGAYNFVFGVKRASRPETEFCGRAGRKYSLRDVFFFFFNRFYILKVLRGTY